MTALTAPATTATRRTPAGVRAAALLTLVKSAVMSYGAYYFSFVFEDPTPGLGTYAFVTVFWALTLTAAVAAVGLLRGSETARRVLVGLCWLELAWTASKLVFWHETEALAFGVATVLVLLVLRGRAAKEWTTR